MLNDLEKPVLLESFNGIEIYNINLSKFKTNSITFFFMDDLKKESAALNALLPMVLKRGSMSHPDIKNISSKLEDLYGAIFNCGTTKKGETQISYFHVETVHDKFSNQSKSLINSAFDLLLDILKNPFLENGVFKNDYVEQEKLNTVKKIESRVNDKMSYAYERCIEEMCKNEAYGISEYGEIKDYEDINNNSLYEYYKTFLNQQPLKVYISGDVDEITLKEIIAKLKTFRVNINFKKLSKSEIIFSKDKTTEIIEKMNVNQAKLLIGLRTGINPQDDDYYCLLVLNSILGGGMHSKLFQNVREKESLAYFSVSRIEKFKSLMIISSGIEISKKEKVYKIILQQINEIKERKITENELEASIRALDTGINSIKDSQWGIVDFYFAQGLLGSEYTLDAVVEKIKKVTIDDVVILSKKLSIDTVYFLTGME